jgi:hypothetical protein
VSRTGVPESPTRRSSKTYALAGWRVGYVAGPACVIAGLRKLLEWVQLASDDVCNKRRWRGLRVLRTGRLRRDGPRPRLGPSASSSTVSTRCGGSSSPMSGSDQADDRRPAARRETSGLGALGVRTLVLPRDPAGARRGRAGRVGSHIEPLGCRWPRRGGPPSPTSAGPEPRAPHSAPPVRPLLDRDPASAQDVTGSAGDPETSARLRPHGASEPGRRVGSCAGRLDLAGRPPSRRRWH